MVARSFEKWLRRSARPAEKTKTARVRRRRLSLEWLEERVVPAAPVADTIDFGGLRFIDSAGFTKNLAGDDRANAGIVQIGYTPSAATGDNPPTPFVPLLIDDMTDVGLSNTFTLSTATNPSQPHFTLTDGHLELQAGVSSPGVPIPLLDPSGDLTFDITQLMGDAGVSIPDSLTVHPITIGKATFTLQSLYLSNPKPIDTTQTQAKFQGSLSFDNDPILKDLGLHADVNGIYYVIADHTGITVTGGTISKAFDLDGVTVTGMIGIGYTPSPDAQSPAMYSFTGGVTVSTEAEDGKTPLLNNVGATIFATISDGVMTSFGFTVTTSFTFHGLTVSTIGNNSQPFSFQYDVTKRQYEIGGGAQVKFGDDTFTADFGEQDQPGIIIQNGQLTSLNIALIINATSQTLNGLSITTTDNNGLDVTYDKVEDEFEVSGGFQLVIPTGSSSQKIGVDLLDADNNPGLIIQDGKVTKLAMNIIADFNVFGLKLSAQPASIDWDPATNTYTIGGTFVANFDVFKSTLTLGDAENPGLKIVNGQFSVGDVTWTINNIVLGPVTVNALTISYAPDKTSFDLNVDLNVTIVNKITVDADFGVVNGKFDSFLIDVQPSPGTLVIPDTGLSIVKLEAKVTNISNPSAIVVTGSMAVVWGEQIPMLGHPVYLFRAEGDVTADADELIIEATAQLGAYSTDNGTTWQGVLGSGDAKLTLDWADSFYSLHVAINGLLGIFDIEGDLVFSSGNEIDLLATATVVVPTEIPFIGGDTIGGVGFFFQHVIAHDNVPASTTFAAWLSIDIFTTFQVGFELVIDGNGHLSDAQFIGGSQVSQFEADVQPPVNQTYAYIYQPTFGAAPGQVPPAASSLILSADWSQSAAGVTFSGQPQFVVEKIVPGQPVINIPESEFAANGISIISDSKFNGPSKGAVQIVGSPTDPFAPLTAQYALQVIFTTEGGNPFPDFPNKTTADYLNIQDT